MKIATQMQLQLRHWVHDARLGLVNVFLSFKKFNI